MSSDKYNFATEIIIQAVCFYIGVALFVSICSIPPFLIFLPYVLPVTFLICIIVNIGFVIRFTKGTTKEVNKIIDKIDDHINIGDSNDLFNTDILDTPIPSVNIDKNNNKNNDS